MTKIQKHGPGWIIEGTPETETEPPILTLKIYPNIDRVVFMKMVEQFRLRAKTMGLSVMQHDDIPNCCQEFKIIGLKTVKPEPDGKVINMDPSNNVLWRGEVAKEWDNATGVYVKTEPYIGNDSIREILKNWKYYGEFSKTPLYTWARTEV